MIYNKIEYVQIPGEKEYFVSRCGKVLSIKRSRPAVLKLDPNHGYWRATFSSSGKIKKHFVHRLVATTFIGTQPSPEHQVNHKNGHTGDNRVENIEWVTPEENRRHSEFVLGRYYPGELSHKAKLTTEMVLTIRALHASGRSYRSLARDLGVNRTTVRRAVTRQTWACT